MSEDGAGGAAAVTHRRVLRIAVPIVLSNATVPILGAVDTGVVGQLGAAAPIGAVGLGAVVVTFLYWLFGFLRMGTSGLVAQARGEGDAAETGALLMRGLLIAGAGGLALIALQWPLFAGAFLVSPASAEVEALTRLYMQIRIWSAPFAIGVFALTGWLIAMERTGAVLVLQIWMNGLNIALDLWFVLGLGWGVGGVAAATVIAETSGAALGLWLCRDAFAGAQWRDWGRVFDRARLRRMMGVNIDILLRSLMLEIGILFFIFQSARAGDLTLAANQILVQFVHVSAYALDGFAYAAEALVGQALGARARAALRRGAWLTSQWGLVAILLLAGGFALLGGALIDVMTTAETVREAAKEFLPWVVAIPLVGLPAWMFDGIFIGATRTRDMRNAMVWSLLIYFAAWAALAPTLGAHGLWAALAIFMGARGVTLALRYPALEAAADAPRGGA